MLYGYRKATPENPHPGRRIPLYLKTVPTLISALGLAILAGVAYPVVSYQLKDFHPLSQLNSGLLSPVSYESAASDDQGPVMLNGLAYPKPSSWFPVSANTELCSSTNK